MRKIRPQAGLDKLMNEVDMSVLWQKHPRKWGQRRDYLTDALSQLPGWAHDGECLKRTLSLDESQHAVLTERISVCADALGVRPQLRRIDGHTQISLCGEITSAEVGLAARIEAMYRAL